MITEMMLDKPESSDTPCDSFGMLLDAVETTVAAAEVPVDLTTTRVTVTLSPAVAVVLFSREDGTKVGTLEPAATLRSNAVANPDRPMSADPHLGVASLPDISTGRIAELRPFGE